MESNEEQTLADIQNEYEEAKSARLIAKTQLDAARGRYHMELVARREAGENLRVSDIRALEKCAVNDIEYVKEAYLRFIACDSKGRALKVKVDAATRDYWDNKPVRR